MTFDDNWWQLTVSLGQCPPCNDDGGDRRLLSRGTTQGSPPAYQLWSMQCKTLCKAQCMAVQDTEQYTVQDTVQGSRVDCPRVADGRCSLHRSAHHMLSIPCLWLDAIICPRKCFSTYDSTSASGQQLSTQVYPQSLYVRNMLSQNMLFLFSSQHNIRHSCMYHLIATYVGNFSTALAHHHECNIPDLLNSGSLIWRSVLELCYILSSSLT